MVVIKPGWCSILPLLVKFTWCLVLYSHSIARLYSNFKCPFASNSVILNFGEAKVTAWGNFCHTSSFSQILATDKTICTWHQHRSPEFKSDQSTFCLGNYWSSREEKGRFSETNSLTRSTPCKASFVSLIFASTSQDVIPKYLELQKLPQSTLHFCLNNVIETLEVNMSKHLKHHIWLLCS
jgi:hypothetical protein